MESGFVYSKQDMLEVKLIDSDSFLKCKETLTRIGIASKKSKELFQSCFILHKQGLYYIVHFKELFALDGKPTTIEFEDIKRRNTIAKLLQEWNLLEIKTKEEIPTCSMNAIKVLSFHEKQYWKLSPKYNLGK